MKHIQLSFKSLNFQLADRQAPGGGLLRGVVPGQPLLHSTPADPGMGEGRGHHGHPLRPLRQSQRESRSVVQYDHGGQQLDTFC